MACGAEFRCGGPASGRTERDRKRRVGLVTAPPEAPFGVRRWGHSLLQAGRPIETGI